MLPGHGFDGGCLSSPQDPDNLFFGKPVLFHPGPPQVEENLT
jgi:hypothetical protein